MNLTDCKPGLLVWWHCGALPYPAKVVRVGKARVTIEYYRRVLHRTSVSPKNLYPRMVEEKHEPES